MRQTIHLSAPPSVLSWANIGENTKRRPAGPLFRSVGSDSFSVKRLTKSGIRHAAHALSKALEKSASEQRTTRLYFRRRPAQSVHRSRFCHAGFSPVPSTACTVLAPPWAKASPCGGAALSAGYLTRAAAVTLLPFLQRRTAVPHAHALWQPASHRSGLPPPPAAPSSPPRETGLYHPWGHGAA